MLDDYLNGKGYLEFLWSHGVISDEAWRRILGNCTFTQADDWQCFVVAHSFQKGNIDLYDIYAPVCLQAANGTYYSSSHVRSMITSIFLWNWQQYCDLGRHHTY